MMFAVYTIKISTIIMIIFIVAIILMIMIGVAIISNMFISLISSINVIAIFQPII